MLSKSFKWELGFVHYIAKFTISRFVISSFECIVTYSCNEYTTTAYTTDIKNQKELKLLTSDQLGVIVEGSMKYTMLQKV